MSGTGSDGGAESLDRSLILLAGIDARLDRLIVAAARLPGWWRMPAVIGSTVVVLAALWAAARLGTRGIL